MLKKNIEKAERKKRPNQWTGYFTRKTPTKQEKIRKLEKKHKKADECKYAEKI